MISRESKVPFYYQLYEILRAKIDSGEWRPGDLLPTETDLLKQYAVSRSTVRQALDMLVSSGMVYRQRGKGSFVAQPTLEQGLSRIISFTEDMQQRGLTPSTQVLASELVAAPDDIAKQLNIAPGDELARLERLRLADGEPLSVEETYLVHRYCPNVLEGDYASTPLREALATNYGLRIIYARQTIRAITAPKQRAHELNTTRDTPLLYIERTSFSQQNVPIEFIRFYHRGDRYVLYNELSD